MKKIFNILSIAGVLGLFMLQSCETTNLDLTVNPNALSPEQASPDYLLNGIQVNFAYQAEGFGGVGAQLTRIDYMGGRSYRSVYSPATFDGGWSNAYTEILTDIRTMTPLAQEAGLNYHLRDGTIYRSLCDDRFGRFLWRCSL